MDPSNPSRVREEVASPVLVLHVTLTGGEGRGAVSKTGAVGWVVRDGRGARGDRPDPAPFRFATRALPDTWGQGCCEDREKSGRRRRKLGEEGPQ